MKKYEILDHKADLKIRVFGKTKKELFFNALLAMVENLEPEYSSSENPKKMKARKINLKSESLETLLVEFLSEVLYLSQVNKEIYLKARFDKFTDNEIEAQIFGKKVKRFNKDIKAVTYHNLNIFFRENGQWEATILFDI